MTRPLILGGGPAGCAAAIALADRGLPPLVIERSREDEDALCGGFLSWRTLGTLDRLGIAADALNPRRITRLALHVGGRRSEAPLPAPGLAVSRRRLDALLRARAVALGAGVERGVAVRHWQAEAATLADGTVLRAPAVVLATGKHDLRGAPRPPAVGSDPAIGLRLRLGPSPALHRLVGDRIELHLFAGGYAGLVLQEDGSANLCMAVRRSRLRAAGDPRRLIAALAADNPALAERLGGRADSAIDAVANVPYGWIARAAQAGLFRIGDQAGVIPSLAGEGVGIALASGVAAAAAIARGDPPAAFQHSLARALARPVGVAGVIRTLAERRAGAAMLLGAARLPGTVAAAARLTRIGRLGDDAARPAIAEPARHGG